jgi:flagellar biosynthesis/type III secretory pathway protein FliH
MPKTLDKTVDNERSSGSRPEATIADRGFEGRLGSRSIRERRREDIERERTRAAAEGLQEPVEEGVDAGEEQIFDEYDEMLMDDDLYNYAEGTMRRRRRQRSWERRRDSWS